MLENIDKTKLFEDAAAEGESPKFVLTLYVAGITPRSLKAIENTKQLCDEYLRGRYELEIIDIYKQPHLASGAQIIAAPTLVKHLPPPLQRFIGDLSEPEPILVRLAIKKEQ